MRTKILVTLFLSWTVSAHANDSCGMRAAKLFASGDTHPLAALFAKDAEILIPLKALADQVGELKNLKEVSTRRFSKYRRLTVQPSDTKKSFSYIGYWINAESGKIGPVQLHIAAEPNEECKLLALHIATEL